MTHNFLGKCRRATTGVLLLSCALMTTTVSSRSWYLSYTNNEYPQGHLDDQSKFTPIGNGRYLLIRDAQRLLYSGDWGWRYNITDGIDTYGQTEISNGNPLRPNQADNSENPKLMGLNGNSFSVSSFVWGHTLSYDENGNEIKGDNNYALFFDENTMELSAMFGPAPVALVMLDGDWDYDNLLLLKHDGDRLICDISFSNAFGDNEDYGFIVTTQSNWAIDPQLWPGYWPGWNYRNLIWANAVTDYMLSGYDTTDLHNNLKANCFKVSQTGRYRVIIYDIFDNLNTDGKIKLIPLDDRTYEPLTVTTADGTQTVEALDGIYKFRATFAGSDIVTLGTGSTEPTNISAAYKYNSLPTKDITLHNAMAGNDKAEQYDVTVDLSDPNEPWVKFEPVLPLFDTTLYLIVVDGGGNWTVADTFDPEGGATLFDSEFTVDRPGAASIIIADSNTPDSATKIFSVVEPTKTSFGGVYTLGDGNDPDNLSLNLTPAKFNIITDLSDGGEPRIKIKEIKPVLGDRVYISYTRYEDTGKGWIMNTSSTTGKVTYYSRIKEEVWHCGENMEPVEGQPGVFTTVLSMRHTDGQSTTFYITATDAKDIETSMIASLVYDPAYGDVGYTTYFINQTIPISPEWGTQHPFQHNSTQGSYRITVDMSDRDNITMTITPEDRWYFYGDMNMWSIIGENAGDPQTIVNKDGTAEKTEATFKNGERYLTPEELNRDWLFQPSEAPARLLAENPDIPTDGWTCLDFSTKSDNDGHENRLCGQFKIMDGYWGGTDFGPNTEQAENELYFDSAVKSGQLYEANFFEGGRNYNLFLDHAYLENAKIYFRRNYELDTTRDIVHSDITYTFDVRSAYIYIDVAPEDCHDIYAYYIGHTGTADDTPPETTVFNDLSQYIYFTDHSTFVNSEWEYVTPAIINGKVYPNGAYRKMIPSGAAHRWPIEFNITVSKNDGTMFPSQRIECEDILFSDRGVNLYVRYANGYEPAGIGYNINQPQYDEEGFELDPLYIAGSRDAFADLTPGVVAQDPTEGGWHRWFMTAVPIDFAQQNCYAIFHTSDNENYPQAGFDSPRRVLRQTEFDGQDMYYVIPATGEGIELLYSHLNGTYHLGNPHKLQIQAEYINNDGTLHTGYNNANYTFTIITPDGNEESASTTEPFMDYVPGAAGIYTVTVEGELNGRRLTAVDRYPVYPDQYGSDELGTPDEAYFLSDFTASTKHPTNPEYNNIKQLDIKHYIGNAESTSDDVNYSWVKFEDLTQYTDENHLWSDNPLTDDENPEDRPNSIDQNHTNHHDCCNFSNAYYRFYAVRENRVSPLSATRVVTAPAGEQRVARTIAVNDNTSGVNNVTINSSAGTLPVYYNLQGIRVSDPADGQIYIIRRGDTVTKQVYHIAN